ncbi:hypothetical protein L1987_29085 [Smallanthus sonchifolius]|uniref:Uncharacterized protein n=1 Tax=Smallanthus sonchifolius TaxID=185202 RepID=A0ACB9HZ01_9ASTR|nr:hypothetical protein L1987_29085 [Smallanthus sonchifolius]
MAQLFPTTWDRGKSPFRPANGEVSKKDLANKKKQENESALANQELEIKKVVEEYNRLKQEAFENSKVLQELLKDHDILTQTLKAMTDKNASEVKMSYHEDGSCFTIAGSCELLDTSIEIAANNKHARIVYAPKAVLTKELKELQLCVSGVLNGERRSLRVFDDLQKFLIDRSHAVDIMLHGYVSDKHHDMNLLKELIDQPVLQLSGQSSSSKTS